MAPKTEKTNKTREPKTRIAACVVWLRLTTAASRTVCARDYGCRAGGGAGQPLQPPSQYCVVGKTTALLETSVEEIFAEFSSCIYSTIDVSVFSHLFGRRALIHHAVRRR